MRAIAPAAALLAALIALVALARRAELGLATTEGAAGMVPATALGILFGAFALLALQPPRSAVAATAGQMSGGLAAAIGFIGIVRYFVDWPLGSDSLEAAAPVWWAQRPWAASGGGLALIGLSIVVVAGGRATHWAGRGAAATLLVALIVLVGHVYGIGEVFGLLPGQGTSIATAFALGMLALGVVFLDPTRGVAAVLASGSSGGRLLRRLVPAAIVVPLGLGAIVLWTTHAGLVDEAFATTLFVASLIALFVGYAVHLARVLYTVDNEREALRALEQAAGDQASGILESITDGFYALDRGWRFTYVNRQAEQMLRRQRDALIGRTIWTEFPETVDSAFETEYRRAMREQRTGGFEAYFSPLDMWFDVRAFPSATGLSVYFHDITARKRAEEQLRSSEEAYRLLVDMIPQHVWTTDVRGHHMYFSRRFYDFTGTTLEQAGGEGWIRLVHPDDRPRTEAVWNRSLQTGEPYAIEYRFRGADGRYHWFLGQAMPLRDADGKIVQWYGTLTEISEQKRLQAERQQLLENERDARAEAERRRAELERVTESRARLMRGFSHDVRNPLSVADAQAWLLAEDPRMGALSDAQRVSVERIRRAIRSSLQLIDDLVELVRAESGDIALDRIALDVGEVARDVAEDFRALADSAGIRLHVRVPAGLHALSDPARIRQILSNLLSNAVKYAPHSDVTIDAVHGEPGVPGIAGDPDGLWIGVRVADTGPGIDPEHREAVFEEYTRLSTGGARGMGIGLAISRRLARLLGGELTLGGAPGGGAAFTLWLPVGPDPADRSL